MHHSDTFLAEYEEFKELCDAKQEHLVDPAWLAVYLMTLLLAIGSLPVDVARVSSLHSPSAVIMF